MRRRTNEGCLGEIRPASDGLHLFLRDPIPVEDDGNRIALEGSRRKNIDLLKRCFAHPETLPIGYFPRVRWPRSPEAETLVRELSTFDAAAKRKVQGGAAASLAALAEVLFL